MSSFRQACLFIAICVVAGACTAAIAQAEAFPLWQLTMSGILVGGLVAWRKLGAGHPLAWMVVPFSVYFLVGVQNWVLPSDRLSFRAYVPVEPTLRLATLGILSYCAGVILVTGLRGIGTGNLARTRHINPELAGRLLLGVGLLGVLVTVLNFGVPIFNPGVRAEANRGLAALLTYAIVPAGLLLTIRKSSVRREVLIILGCSSILILLAYRSPVVLLFVSYLLSKAILGEVRDRVLILGVVGLLIFGMAIHNYRSQSIGRTPSAVARGPLARYPTLFSLYIGFPREGVAVLARMRALVPDGVPFSLGRVQGSAINALLPGEQKSPREYVTNLAYGTTIAPTSLTPTILGGPYLDFGPAGVAVEMLLLGAVTGTLYRTLARRRNEWWPPLVYGYWTGLLLLSIHAGLLDATSVILVPLMALFALVVTSARPKTRRVLPSASRA